VRRARSAENVRQQAAPEAAPAVLRRTESFGDMPQDDSPVEDIPPEHMPANGV